MVARGQRAQFGRHLLLGRRGRQSERQLLTDTGRDGVVEQRVQIVIAERVDHRSLLACGADVPIGEALGVLEVVQGLAVFGIRTVLRGHTLLRGWADTGRTASCPVKPRPHLSGEPLQSGLESRGPGA